MTDERRLQLLGKCRPILLSGSLPLAARERLKTHTRRIIKPQPPPNVTHCGTLLSHREGQEFHWMEGDGTLDGDELCGDWFRCPHGQPGDRLWVREEHYRFGHWERAEGISVREGGRWRFVPVSEETRYSDNKPEGSWGTCRSKFQPRENAWYKRLARFMPRSASRTLLEITSVRVERLQEICEEDAVAEGVSGYREGADLDAYWVSAREAFRDLWNSINGPASWDLNSWVWVIEFRNVEGGGIHTSNTNYDNFCL